MTNKVHIFHTVSLWHCMCLCEMCWVNVRQCYCCVVRVRGGIDPLSTVHSRSWYTPHDCTLGFSTSLPTWFSNVRSYLPIYFTDFKDKAVISMELCLFHTADTSLVLSVSALWTELATSQDCQRQKILKLNMFSFLAVLSCLEMRDSTKLFSTEDCWRLSSLVASSVHTTDTDKTRQSCVNQALWTLDLRDTLPTKTVCHFAHYTLSLWSQ